MERWEAWLVWIATGATALTGLAWAGLKYLVEPADPFAVVNHPLQPVMQHLHVLAAPLLVFAAGLIWSRHVLAALRSGRSGRRRSGLIMAVGLLPMIASGYLLQVSVDPRWNAAWVGVHLVSSVLWLAALAAHRLAPAKAASRKSHAEPATAGQQPGATMEQGAARISNRQWL